MAESTVIQIVKSIFFSSMVFSFELSVIDNYELIQRSVAIFQAILSEWTAHVISGHPIVLTG